MKRKLNRFSFKLHQSKSLFARLILLFCIIFSGFLLLIGGFSYFSYVKIFQEKAEDYNNSRLKQMRQVIDQKFEKIHSLTMDLVTQNMLQKDFNEFSVKDKIFMMQNFFSQSLTNDYIYSIYIYYLDSKTIISSDNRLTTIQNFDDREWIQNIGDPTKLGIQPVYINNRVMGRGGDSKQVLSIVRKFPLISLPVKGLIVLNIDSERMFADMHNAGLNDEKLFILDNKKELISGNADYFEKLRTMNKFNDLLSGKENSIDFRIDHDKILALQVTSEVNKWQYISAENISGFDRVAKRNINYIFILIVISLVSGIGIWLKLSGRLYKPISNLVDKVTQIADMGEHHASLSQVHNEVEMLNQMVDSIVESKQIYESMYKNSRGDSIRGLLINLFRGEYKDEEYLKEQLEIGRLNFVPTKYCVSIFSIEEGQQDKRLRVEKMSMLQIAIDEVIHKKFQHRIAMLYTSFDDQNLVGVALIADENIEIMKVFKYVQNELISKNQMLVTVALGNNYENLLDCYVSYQEALETMEYKIFTGKGTMLQYQDYEAQEKVTSYNYPISKEIEFMDAIKQGDKKTAIAIIDEIYGNIPRTVNMVKYVSEILWQLMNGLLLGLNTMGIKLETITSQTMFECFEEFKKLRDIDEMVLYIKNQVEKITNYIEQKRNNKNEKIIAVIIEYIETHYDEDLTLDGIAAKVFMSPPYFSTVFKEIVGENLSDYVRNVRIEKAKELIVSTKKDLNKIGELVGYENSRSFFRVFKKCTGLTPNEYRKLNSADKLAQESE